MYDFSNSEELRSFFNINPELEPSQRVTTQVKVMRSCHKKTVATDKTKTEKKPCT